MHNDKARCTSICIAAIISLAAAVAVAEVLPGASTGFEIRDTQPYTLYVKEPAQGTVDFASAAAALSGGSQAAAVTVIQPGMALCLRTLESSGPALGPANWQ